MFRPVLLYRRLRCGYTFCRIPLTQGKYAIVDPDDYFRLSKFKWYVVYGGSTYYAVRTNFIEGKRHRLPMHRAILKVADGMVVDHINHNGLDNRKANLRVATVAQNAWNAERPTGRSGYRGVSFDRRVGKWRVIISCCGKRKRLGYFSDKHEAAKVYDQAAKKYHGKFAILNFPE